ncbi:hypothetical protein A4H97_00125 [Niastella yeongjuensis]|uniref:FAS1 domain-containing protein n=1 Tax=Niastella yeongjuensis TaxID=354355 RepID=A0A1V9EVY5_9BACT|nr:fasciclin domain-containing protein [Niastella yeongjuensis]OQP50291.1 hypothetical protein A4H97_00125 [Niastella yeongjuensis]SEN40910.1 Fasciclin domain-containing protein [Niastella yeongjuensis]
MHHRNQFFTVTLSRWINRSFFIGVMGCVVLSCQKKGDDDFVAAKPAVSDTSSDLRATLRNTPFTLFRQAAEKINLDSLLPGSGYFTVFAPVDEAMTAAGLDQAKIQSLSVDSLRKIIMFHVAQGSYGAGALSSALCNIEMKTLRLDATIDLQYTGTSLYQQNLYVKKSGALYINGELANNENDTAWTASNGYIWPIRAVLNAPTQNLWNLIKSRPELSLYYTAMHINDSLYWWNYLLPDPLPPGQTWYQKSVAGDSISFNFIVYENLPNTQTYGRSRPTVFAPTNDAFHAAGFYTYDDLLKYNRDVIPGWTYDENWNGTWADLPLDSVLKNHVILNVNEQNVKPAFSNLSLYNDLMFNPNINNGSFNNLYYWNLGNGNIAPTPNPLLQFSAANGAVKIKYKPNIAPVDLPADKNRHLMATNGAIYEIDKLFLPQP